MSIGTQPIPRIAIVQNRPTQLDDPVFRELQSSGRVRFDVYYLETAQRSRFDAELGLTPNFGDFSVPSFGGDSVLKRLHAISRLLRQKYDLVIVAGYDSFPKLAVSLVLRAMRRPVGLRADSVLWNTPQKSVRAWLKHKVLPLFFRLTYRTGHPCGRLSYEYLRAFGFKDEQLFTYPYVVDNARLESLARARTHTAREEVRTRLGIPTSTQVILGVLKFSKREDPMTLLVAFADLVRKGRRDVQLILVGDGPLGSQVRDYVMHTAADLVHLVGYVEYGALFDYFFASDVFVHPAANEPFGISVVEAMICGLPAIVSNRVGAAADLILEGKTGFVFDVGNNKQLARLLEIALADRSLLVQMGASAKQSACAWSPSIAADSICRAACWARDHAA